ncbi:MAG TPA: 2-dehydropantoate 2-reductase N-terminal domain-containing protein [Kribbella sp.]|uniref:ketopantoate reductase family protein n=1 Tax=Kribbella sp. TaxID=1871183 RepID=UPI002D77F18A|nr:2-dehydropantoate 2-reductase N-terminal domain-containing protein [Kribbella sp.]HET6293964.1 2-dehydropantoate 2-reductase N-terminal domain-containing protein [Kribbella sp.]
MSRYVVIGAGAIGGGLGGRLVQHGLEAVLVARGEHAAAMAEHGLRLRSPEEDIVLDVPSASGPDDVRLAPDDVLVLATKAQQAIAALTQWADVPVYRGGTAVGTAGELLPICTALNGVASESMAARYFARVIGVCVWVPAIHLRPGEVMLRSAPRSGMFHLGSYPAGDRDAALLAGIRDDWTKATFKVSLPADVMPWKYRKLIDNVGNCFQALIGRNGDYRPLVAATRAEAREVLTRAGIAFTSDEDEAAARADSFVVHPVPGEPEELGGSSWQSLTRATGSIETDYLNGEIALIARQHGLSAPINAKIASIARVAAATRQRPGGVSADEIRTRLGLA